MRPVRSIAMAFVVVGSPIVFNPARGDTNPQENASSRPNILFIMTDQQQAGMLSCTGNPYVKTPALDALAASGTRFELTYATNPVCVPSRFSLQTGRMPSAIGMRLNQPELPVGSDICAESLGPLMKKAGYQCVYGGKDHNPAALSKYIMQNGYENLTPDQRDELAVRCADFLKKPHDRPFFLFASFINPHDICYMAINDHLRSQDKPIEHNVDSKFCEKLLGQAPNSKDLKKFIHEHCPPLPANFEVPDKEPTCISTEYLDARPFRRYIRDEWSADMWRLHRWLYCRLTESVDAQIGVVLQALRESGLEDNTLVIFTSDHGDMDSAHHMEHKSVLYEEAVRVPFLMAWKGKLPTGRVDRVHFISNGLDLLPTLCDFAGVVPPAGLSGRSVRALLNGNASGWRDYVVSESQNGRMVRSERYKYCVYDRGENREMLIDLQSDPGEMKNLADSPEHRGELNRHRKLLRDWVEQIHDSVAKPYLIKPE